MPTLWTKWTKWASARRECLAAHIARRKVHDISEPTGEEPINDGRSQLVAIRPEVCLDACERLSDHRAEAMVVLRHDAYVFWDADAALKQKRQGAEGDVVIQEKSTSASFPCSMRLSSMARAARWTDSRSVNM